MPLLSNLLSKDIPQNFYKFQFQIYSILYLVGLLGFFYLSSPIVSRRTYISENALSPGLVSGDLYVSGDQIKNLIGDLRTGFKSQNVTDVIQLVFSRNGIEAYRQDLSDNSTNRHDANVYGIVRAPRTASTESLILVAPLYVRIQSETQTHKANLFGIAQTLAIGLALHRKPYMAKDIILLFPSSQELGTSRWLDAYYNNDPNATPLDAHAGSIQAGLALEFPYEKFFSIDLKHNGINGQLPNLDLFNTVVQLCEKNSIATSLYGVYVDLSNTDIFLEYIFKSIRTLALNLLTLATGLPDGVHGQFLHYRIEMITLFGTLDKNKEYQKSPVAVRAFVDVVEGVIRSMNNLLERFHQSFFFYFLVNRRGFVSIATYMIPLGLLVLPALIRCLVLYMSFFTSTSNTENLYTTHGRTMNFRVDYAPIFRETLECVFLCYAMSWFPLKLSLIGVSLLTMYISPMILRPLRSTERQFDYFQFLLLLIGCALLGCLSLLNFSLAFLVGCFLMPCYFIAGASKFNHIAVKLIARFIFITILNPLVFLMFYHYLTQLLKAGTFVLPNPVQFSADLDDYFASFRLFNVWTVDVLCLTIAPLWLLLYRSTYWLRV